MTSDINKRIKKEAGIVLDDLGLTSLLKQYGDVTLSGSYTLDVMVWRDLDFFVDLSEINQEKIYELSTKIFKRFRPVWFETRDTFEDTSGCPNGYFIGFESLINDQLWNFDIWFTNRSYISQAINYVNEIKSKMTDQSREIIIEIKQILCKNKEYGEDYFSIDIYNAVLNDQVKTLSEFKLWLQKKKDITF